MSCYLVRPARFARADAPSDSGHIARELVARSACARAYGAATPRQVDFIDVAFEEVAAPVVSSLVRGGSTRALPSGAV